MKRLAFLMMLIISTAAVAQQQGIGLRLGDPMGVSYKKYFGRTHAIEFGIGSAPANWNNQYYINSFQEYPRYDNYRYQNHTVQSTLYLQARYLFHYNIPVQNMEGKFRMVLGWRRYAQGFQNSISVSESRSTICTNQRYY